jgi:hypothetical protein
MRNFWIAILCLALLAAVFIFLKPDAPATEESILRDTERMFDTDEPLEIAPVRPVQDEPPASQPDGVAAVHEESPATTLPDSTLADSQPAATEPQAASLGESVSDGLATKIPHAEVAPGKIYRQPDGTIRVDDRFTLTGDGSREHPYKLTWEYLMSAAESYQPRLAQLHMPQRIAMLHGKWVSIEGNVAFPLAATSPREILAMLNMWDGCCIGVPPSPYDAIEVRLVEPVAPTKRHTMTYGTVTGRLSVEPYLMESWLVGIYIMDEATLEQDI